MARRYGLYCNVSWAGYGQDKLMVTSDEDKFASPNTDKQNVQFQFNCQVESRGESKGQCFFQ